MYKLCIFILFVLFSPAAVSQSYKTDQLKAIKVSDSSPQSFYSDYQKSKINLYKQNLVGEHFVFTDYDYATNNSMRPMVDFADYDNDGISNAIVTAMVRQDAAIRTQETGFRNQDGFYIINPFNTGISYGWGTIQYANTGPEEGNIFIMGHSGGISRVAKINIQTQTGNEISSFGKNFPSFVYVNDGTIWATTTDANIYKSTDGGVTFDSVIAIGTGDPNVSFSDPENGPAEIPIQASDDGAFIAIVGCWAEATSSDDNITYIYYSNDFGNTWTGKIISIDGEYGQVSNRNYAPSIAIFGQATLNVDNSGIIHVAANGYGNGIIDNDTVPIIPVLYWNSHINTWIALTDEEFEKVTDAGGVSMLDPRIFAGNGVGNAYPGITTGPYGDYVFCAWQTSEYDDQGNFVIYPGDGTPESTLILFTDIKGRYSSNGGYDWTDLLIIADEDSVMEQFPNLARRIDFNYIDEKVSSHMMYMIDVRPGVSIFGGGLGGGQNSSDNNTEWRYIKYDLEDLYDIKDQNTELTYSLSINYPNPFNPLTTIKFSLAKDSDISLKVYDVLGNETAVLAEGFFNSGSHKVNFNGANLSSGVYIYTLRTAEFTSSKKMLLIK